VLQLCLTLFAYYTAPYFEKRSIKTRIIRCHAPILVLPNIASLRRQEKGYNLGQSLQHESSVYAELESPHIDVVVGIISVSAYSLENITANPPSTLLCCISPFALGR
jgi:hypothetical protein